MLIWLGKQILGQRNHVHEPTRPSDAPISVEQVRSKILGLIAKRAKRAARRTKAPPGETEQTSQEAEARAGFPSPIPCGSTCSAAGPRCKGQDCGDQRQAESDRGPPILVCPPESFFKDRT
jgi:hypothetical protein